MKASIFQDVLERYNTNVARRLLREFFSPRRSTEATCMVYGLEWKTILFSRMTSLWDLMTRPFLWIGGKVYWVYYIAQCVKEERKEGGGGRKKNWAESRWHANQVCWIKQWLQGKRKQDTSPSHTGLVDWYQISPTVKQILFKISLLNHVVGVFFGFLITPTLP